MAEENKNPETREEEELQTPVEEPGTVPEQETTPAPRQEDEPAGKKPKRQKGADAKLAAAETKADEAEKKAQELQNTLMRTAAEYDNYRKRTQKERDAAFNDGVAHAALTLLPVIDTLEAAANAPTEDEEYKKGVLLTLQQCADVFQKLGIEEIPAAGQPFDPEVHDAVMQQPAEGADSGTITQVVRKGYKLGDRVVRHCMVCVAP